MGSIASRGNVDCLSIDLRPNVGRRLGQLGGLGMRGLHSHRGNSHIRAVIGGAVLLAGTAAGAVFVTPASALAPYSINTVAGGGVNLPSGIPPSQSGYTFLSAVSDSAGDLFMAGSGGPSGVDEAVLEIPVTSGTHYGVSMTAGNIYVIAGPNEGFSGDGGPATSASLNFPNSIALDSLGDVYITSPYEQRIREVAAVSGTQHGIAMTAGDIYTVVGNGSYGFSGDGGPATSAALALTSNGGFGDRAAGVAVDSAGNLYINDGYNNRIREVAAASGTQHGIAMTAGDIYTIVGNGTYGNTGQGGPASSAELETPQGVAVGPTGDIYISELLNDGTFFGDVLLDVPSPSGTKYGVTMTAGDVYRIVGDGGLPTAVCGGSATSSHYVSLRPSIDSVGNVFITDATYAAACEVPAGSGTYSGQA